MLVLSSRTIGRIILMSRAHIPSWPGGFVFGGKDGFEHFIMHGLSFRGFLKMSFKKTKH
jgi:hypothetical protein